MLTTFQSKQEKIKLPEHKVIPTKMDRIHAVYPLPSWKSFKNSTYNIPNE